MKQLRPTKIAQCGDIELSSYTGVLMAQKFLILTDPVSSSVLQEVWMTRDEARQVAEAILADLDSKPTG
jgi:hypothetical protein